MASRARIFGLRARVFESQQEALIDPVDAGSGGGVTVYANTDTLPLSGVDNGSLAHVISTNRLYMWTGTGWYNIALINQTPTIQANSYSSSYTLDNAGANTVIELVASDPEDLPITWTYTTTLTGNTATIEQSNNVFTITPSTLEADAGTFYITFKASDGVNIGTATSSFTLAFLSPYWKNVALLTGTNDTNGLQNDSFIDRSTNGHTITPAGDVTQSAFHPYLDNYSVYFNGSGDWLRDDTIGDEIQTAFVDTGVTIEFWAYPEFPESTTDPVVIGSNSSTAGNEFLVQADLIALYSNGGFSSHSYSSGMNRYQWNHYVIQFDKNDSMRISVWINGSRVLNMTRTGWFDMSNNSFGFGAESDSGYWGSLGNYWKGYIFDMRMTTGPVYGNVDNIDVPTAIQETLASTFIHIFKSNNWSTDRTYSVGGTPKTTAYSPFGQSSVYAPGENKGSAYFDGSGDYLDSDAASDIFSPGTGNFTVEGWFYFPNNTTDLSIVGSSISGGFDFRRYSDGTLRLGRANVAWDTISAALQLANEWHHIALVRSSGTVSIYVDGVAQTISSGASNTIDYNSSSHRIKIGYNGIGTSVWGLGYYSDIRLSTSTVYTSNFTPPTSPVGNTNASLYLPMDNAGIFDQAGNHTLSLGTNIVTSTTQTKYATSSMYFNGTGEVAIPADLLVTDTDFTFEGWVYLNSIGGTRALATFANTVDNIGFWFGTDVLNWFLLIGNGSSWYANQRTGTVNTGQWYHFAVVQNGSSITLYIDGTSTITLSSANLARNNSSTFSIGGRVTSAQRSDCYMEDVQYLNGQAKYTSNFTPPTASLSSSIQ